MQKHVFVKIDQIDVFKLSPVDKYRVYVHLIPTEEGSFVDLQQTPINTLETQNIWKIKCHNQATTSLRITIYKNVNKMFANLTLPLSWFPVNKVVLYEYPFRVSPVFSEGKPVMGTILVHLSENGVGLFGAPHGTLLKRPAWNITERTKQMIQNGSYQLIDTNPYSLIPPSQPIQQTPNPYTSPYPPAQQYPTYYQVPIPQYASTQNNTNMCYPQTTVTATPTVQQHYQQQYVYPTQPNVSYQSSSPTETNQVGTYDTFLPIYPQN